MVWTWDSGLSITAVQVKWSCTLQRLGPQGMRNTAQTRMMLTLTSRIKPVKITITNYRQYTEPDGEQKLWSQTET